MDTTTKALSELTGLISKQKANQQARGLKTQWKNYGGIIRYR